MGNKYSKYKTLLVKRNRTYLLLDLMRLKILGIFQELKGYFRLIKRVILRIICLISLIKLEIRLINIKGINIIVNHHPNHKQMFKLKSILRSTSLMHLGPRRDLLVTLCRLSPWRRLIQISLWRVRVEVKW